jgi:hypothetical protein
MSDYELEIDYKWKSEKLENENKELIEENKRLHLEIGTLLNGIENLYEKLSKVSTKWFPPFSKENPRSDNLSDESASGTLNSVITLCEREPSLLKKFNSEILHFLLDFLLFSVRQLEIKLTSSIFSFQRGATQTSQRKTKFMQLRCINAHFTDHLKQPNSSSILGLM